LHALLKPLSAIRGNEKGGPEAALRVLS